jgi:hypothetical protein
MVAQRVAALVKGTPLHRAAVARKAAVVVRWYELEKNEGGSVTVELQAAEIGHETHPKHQSLIPL